MAGLGQVGLAFFIGSLLSRGAQAVSVGFGKQAIMSSLQQSNYFHTLHLSIVVTEKMM
jgi:hypothetical protein